MAPLTGEALEAALRAETEGRLGYCMTDQHGRSCNGGRYQNSLPSLGSPGEWSPTAPDPKICKRGYHITRDPVRWRGLRVWVAELDRLAVANKDKLVGGRRRLLGELTPTDCLTARMFVAVNRPNLQGADLQRANLQRADLRRADLQGADLYGANLQGANLQRANLQRANLQRADLQGANLHEANLQRANLHEAYLQGADLYGANLQRANLQWADLQRADLQGADLQRAYLQGADLQWADLQRADLQGAIGYNDIHKEG